MGIGPIYKGIGKGRFFGYGRMFGVHNPLGSRIGKAKDPHINLITLSRLSLSNKTEIKNAAVDNISGRLRSPSSKAQIEHIFNSFDRKIIARVLSSNIFDHPWMQEPVTRFIFESTEEELESGNYRKALIWLTSSHKNVDVKNARRAYLHLAEDMTYDEHELIAMLGPTPEVAGLMADDRRISRKALFFLAHHDYGADKEISSNIYSELKKTLSGEELLVLSQSKNKFILENICLNHKSSPKAIANAILGLIEKNGNEYDMKSVEKICLLIEARPTGRTEVIRIIYDKDFHLASLIFGHYLRPGKNYLPFSY